MNARSTRRKSTLSEGAKSSKLKLSISRRCRTTEYHWAFFVCCNPAGESQAMPATVEATTIQLSFRVLTDRLYAPCRPTGDKDIRKIPRFSIATAAPPSRPSSPVAPERFGSVKGLARAFFPASPDRVIHAPLVQRLVHLWLGERQRRPETPRRDGLLMLRKGNPIPPTGNSLRWQTSSRLRTVQFVSVLKVRPVSARRSQLSSRQRP